MLGSKKKKRFQEVYRQGIENMIIIIVDRETGVHYLQAGTRGGVTPLLDGKGKVVINRAAATWEE